MPKLATGIRSDVLIWFDTKSKLNSQLSNEIETTMECGLKTVGYLCAVIVGKSSDSWRKYAKSFGFQNREIFIKIPFLWKVFLK